MSRRDRLIVLLAIGSSVGIVRAAALVHEQRYLQQGLERLALQVAREQILMWTAAAALVHVVLVGLRALGKRLRPRPAPATAVSAATTRTRVLAWLPLGVAALVCLVERAHVLGKPPPQGPNVVLVVLDTVRKDRLSCYGYERPTTVEIDRLAARGARYTRAYSTSCWTLPAHASLFTGLFPSAHGATQERVFLEPDRATLAEQLAEAGYRTIAVSANPVVSTEVGLTQGFGTVVELWRRMARWRYGETTDAVHPAARAVRELATRGEAPFFLFVNLIDAHATYRPPAEDAARFLPASIPAERIEAANRRWQEYYAGSWQPTAEELALRSALYDACVAFVSRTVGAVEEALRENGVLDDTWIIVTSDHGENLGDNRHLDHVFALTEDTIAIPLIVVPPGGGPASVVADPVQLTDLYSAILSLADTTRGGALTALRIQPGERPGILCELGYPLQALSTFRADELAAGVEPLRRVRRRLRSLETERGKLVWASDGRHELYDLVADPHETRDLLATGEPIDLGPWLEPLARFFEETVGVKDALQLLGDELPVHDGNAGLEGLNDEETLERLRDLGYAR